MKFDDILKNKYLLLNEQPPEELPAESEATPDAEPAAEDAAESPEETPAAALDSQGAQYLIDLIRKALIINVIDDREKANLVNLKIDANNSQDVLTNTLLPIINKYVPDTTS